MKKFIFLFFMFFAFLGKINASYLELYRINNTYSSQYNIDSGDYYSYRQNRYVMDGRMVYCVEPGVDITTREYTPLDLSYSSLPIDVLNRISLIGYFGYDYPGHQTDNYFLATQELIWETVGNNEVHFTTEQYNMGSIIDIDYEKNEIISLIDNFNVKPLFDTFNVEGVFGDEIVLTDSNGVLSNYEIVSSNNDAYIDGNNLVIRIKEIGEDELILSRKKYDNNESILYDAYNSQNFMFLRVPDERISININGYIPYSSVSIFKTGEMLSNYVSGEFLYEEKGLSGIVFELFSDEDIYVNNNKIYDKDQLIQELVTEDGFASSTHLPNGRYYLKEKKTDNLFILNEDPIYFELFNDKSEVLKYDLFLRNERKPIIVDISKNGEVLDGTYQGLEGVEIGLYSSEDIYNYRNEKIVDKDTLIESFITDSNGRVYEEKNLPVCSYYFKELKTMDNYIINDQKYNSKFDIDELRYYLDEPIKNLLKRGNIVINKLDINGNLLDGAYFSLFDENDNVVYSGYSVNGVLNINDVLYGRYRLYESVAPYGYIKSDSVNEIDILEDGVTIYVDVYNEKLPITSDIHYYEGNISIFLIIFGFLGIIYEDKVKAS